MKQEEFKKSLTRIEPTGDAQQRMLHCILQQNMHRQTHAPRTHFLRAMPVLAVLVLLCGVGGYFLRNMLNNELAGQPEPFDPSISIANGNEGYGKSPDEFTLDGKKYVPVYLKTLEGTDLPKAAPAKDIGAKLAEITSAAEDSGLLGRAVYEYKPAGCTAMVAVEKDGAYLLYNFWNFTSYEEQNQDEDTAAYLSVYGISGPQDIEKVEFLRAASEITSGDSPYLLAAKLTVQEDIQIFYDYYSVLKNSSDEYFEQIIPSKSSPALSSFYNGAIAESKAKGSASSGAAARSEAAAESTAGGNTGSNALSDSVTLRIYNNHGLFLQTEYYPHIQFISRHKIQTEFAAYLDALSR